MIQSIIVTNPRGESITLPLKNPEQSGFFILGANGLGPVKAVINMTEVLSLDGAFYNSARKGTRNITLALGYNESSGSSIEELRHVTYRYFPVKGLISLEIVSDERTAVTTGYVESNEVSIFSKNELSFVSILCPKASLFGESVIQTIFSGYTPSFEFPFENPSLTDPLIEFGLVYLDTEKSVYYEGDEETGVVIRIKFNGAVTDLSIYNTTYYETMDISSAKLIAQTGEGFHLNDEVVISTIKGSKYIRLYRDGQVINILNALDANSDWFTLRRGDNVFSYAAASGVNRVQLTIEHQLVYEGI